jgi:hypothetical protein
MIEPIIDSHPVAEQFKEKYCDECTLNAVCKHHFNIHCVQVIESHERAVDEIAQVLNGES